MFKLKILPLFFFFFSASLSYQVSGEDTTAFIYAGCSQLQYAAGTPYQLNADSILTSLANAASFSSYGNFTSSTANLSPPVSGLFQCRGDLPGSTCQSCVRSALTQLGELCPSACGGAIQLRGCFIRYGNESFIGKPDTMLLYKRCGPSPGGSDGIYTSSNLAGERDAALAAVQGSAAEGYRNGAAGEVQAERQCVGDINSKECGECVNNAVDQLRSGCGFAVSGEVYLGKCYARYWSSSRDDYASSRSSDDTGKTLAIIIGLLAGIALLIIFLSLINRSSKGK